MKSLRLLSLLGLLAFGNASISSASSVEDDSGKVIPFKGIARIHSLKAKGKYLTAETTYPTFRTSTRLTRFTNRQISVSQRKALRDWVNDAKKYLKDDVKPVGNYEFTSDPTLSYYLPSRLISLRFDSYEFTGGAHGMSVMSTRNFGMVAGKPKEIVLGDLFKPGSDYRKTVETQIFAKLKKDPDAEWVQDGSVKKLENSQFNNFSIEPDGVRWLFNQYEMGPYVVGQFEIKLSLKELGPNFRRELLK